MSGKTRIKKKHIIIICILAAITVLSAWTIRDNTALMTSEIVIESSRVPSVFDGFRIAQISDLHNAEFGRDNENLISMLREAKPDLIVITGDLIDSGHTDIQTALDFVAGITDNTTCFYVTGNHEGGMENYGELEKGLLNAGVAVLHDAETVIERGGETISFVGIDDPVYAGVHGGITSGTILPDEVAALSTTGGYTILLSHRPELFSLYCEAGFDLVFTGHAHGGQVRLPFIGGLVAPGQELFPDYDAGLFTAGITNMVVSRGLGNSIIPLRFNNRPEIVVVELRYKQAP